MRQLFYLIFIVALTSCSSVQRVSYFQDARAGQGVEGAKVEDIRFEPGDQLSILVNTKDELLDDLFNLSVATRLLGANGTTGQNLVALYRVDPKGDIDFPVLGRLSIEGMSCIEVSEEIQQRLVEEQLAADPIVTVEPYGLYFSVLGEVAAPGRYSITADNITLMDAISMAGDLTIYGERDGVMVLREQGGEYTPYMVNLLDMSSVYSSPVYYLRQNDLIYVEPNEVRARQSTLNGNNLRSTSFWISLSSLVVTVALLFI